MITCEMESWLGRDDLPCGVPAVATLTMMCVHEHVEHVPLCGFCRGLVLRGSAYCSPCFYLDGDAHPCRLGALVEVDLAGNRRTLPLSR